MSENPRFSSQILKKKTYGFKIGMSEIFQVFFGSLGPRLVKYGAQFQNEALIIGFLRGVGDSPNLL